MTLDEAIQYAEDLGKEEENKIDYDKDSPHTITRRKNTVKDYRQLAEWLKELKELKSSIGAVKLELLKEAQAELEKRGNMLHDAIAELEEAKRLLKDFVSEYDGCKAFPNRDEVLKLIGEDEDENS